MDEEKKVEAASKPLHVAVVGAGIMGCATAYFLTKLDPKITCSVIERHEVANAASGKAGGFLAGGWGGNETDDLHERGFALHEKLAKELKIASYRKLPTMQVQWGGSKKGSAVKHVKWLDGKIRSIRKMDDKTAQVTPLEITTKMLQAALDTKRCKLVKGQCTGVQVAKDDKKIQAVLVDGKPLACDHAVFTLGPWSVLLEDWFPGFKVPMTGIRSSSIVFTPKTEIQGVVLFTGEDSNGCHLEVYPRPKPDPCYICGLGGSKHLRKKDISKLAPEEVKADPTRVTAALKSFSEMSSLDTTDRKTQACMRPCPDDGLPMIGPIPETKNGWIAAGHNCWGILWGPITGQITAELVLGKKPTVDLGDFDPARFSKTGFSFG